MSDPTVNIFDALRRMGAKIPFRFPMVDTLVPTVQMYDVSRLVATPIEARGVAGERNFSTAAGKAFVVELAALSPGGLFIDILQLHNDLNQVAGAYWTMLIRAAPSVATTAVPVQSVGGPPPRSLVKADEANHDPALEAGAAFVQARVTFRASPRFHVPAGSRMILQTSASTAIGEQTAFTISWAELPASFEPA